MLVTQSNPEKFWLFNADTFLHDLDFGDPVWVASFASHGNVTWLQYFAPTGSLLTTLSLNLHLVVLVKVATLMHLLLR